MQSGDQLLQLFDDHLEVIVNPCDYVCDYAQAIGGVVTTNKIDYCKIFWLIIETRIMKIYYS